ncbi:NAD(P)-dependent oxidoreductase [Nonomuraea sp. NPDC050663]|uniref:NAD(P)-dependent oxidoreductase n=1 Tax=Nonomuraea sp. NPDC050663 TaxID=3364370 RepID=UPI00378AE9FE
MSRIVVFGAGGRVGRAAVAEARRRGHEVTEAGNDEATDVRDPRPVAAVAAGHDAVINAAAVYGEGTDPAAFFPAAARALLTGLAEAGVPRLVSVGLAVVKPGPDGVRLMDSPGFPAEFLPFCLAHASGLDVLRAEGDALDWLYLAPVGDFDAEGERTGHYTVGEYGDMAARISHADFAIALVDEALAPKHHREHLAVT